MPPALADGVPERHRSRFVSAVVDGLDLAAIADTDEEDRGAPPYPPRMLVKVLLYAYATGTYSSRRIAAPLEDRVAFQFLAAGNKPDFRTISDFRTRHGAALSTLFGQVLRLCQKAGLVTLGRVAVDGTKIQANASKHQAMSYGRRKTTAAALARAVEAWLRRAAQTDADEDRRYGTATRGDELPDALAHRAGRRQKIREAQAALQAEAQEQARAEGQDPNEATPQDTAQRNFTDPESRMQKPGRTYLQGYNAPVAVDAEAQVIVAHHVTAEAPDVRPLLPLVPRIPPLLRRTPRPVLADAGEWSDVNVQGLERLGVEPVIAPHRRQHTDPLPRAPRGRPPRGLSAKERMTRKRLTLRGRAIDAWRQILPEPVFGQIQHARGCRPLLRRGLRRVQEDWAMIGTVHHLLKRYRGAT